MAISPELFRETITYDRVEDTPIGVIVPFDFGIDWQYWRYVPPNVSLHFTRTPYLRTTVGLQLAKEVGKPTVVARATRALNAIDPVVTVYACSSGSFVRGLEGERDIRRQMLDAGANRAVTTSGATLEALRALGARRVAVASPYTLRLTNRLVAFLEEAGFEVVSAVYLGISTAIALVTRDTVAGLLRRAASPDADAIFVSCTGLRTLGIVAKAEEETGLPILTSNQVTLWAALREAEALPSEPPWEVIGPVLGDHNPMARSTAMLLDAARREPRAEAG